MEEALPQNPPIDLARFWARRTHGVRRFVNAAWFVESFLPYLFLSSLAVTVGILVARREGWRGRYVEALGLVLALVAAGVAFAQARRRFISEGEARAKIETGLRLHSRLSAAAAGVGSWPAADRWQATLWRWHWRKLAVLPLCSVALLVAALWLPIVPSLVENTKPPLALPPALVKVESELEKLAATPEIAPESLLAVQEEARQLEKQDPADWYSHASLEAADHLKSKVESGMKALSDQSAKLQKLLGQNPAEAGAPWNEKLQSALSALQGNVPGLSKELSESLAGLDPSMFKSLSPEQLEQLKKSLKKAQKVAGDGEGEGEDGETPHGNNGGQDGDGTEEGEGAGNGGVDRGPGTAPLKLGHTADLDTKKTEALPGDDLTNSALGETLGMSAGQHEVDKTKSGRSAEGGVGAVGEGAGAVWQQQHVTPEERKRLQQFFQ